MGVRGADELQADGRWAGVGRSAELIGGLALVASAFLPWIAHGAGSSLDLHDLGDLVLGGSVSAVVPRWVGLAAYLIPVVGAGLIVASSVEGRFARRVTAACGVAAVVLVAGAVVLPFVRHGRPAWGQLVAGVGAMVAVAGIAIRRWSTPDDSSRVQRELAEEPSMRVTEDKSNDSVEISGSSVPSSK